MTIISKERREKKDIAVGGMEIMIKRVSHMCVFCPKKQLFQLTRECKKCRNFLGFDYEFDTPDQLLIKCDLKGSEIDGKYIPPKE